LGFGEASDAVGWGKVVKVATAKVEMERGEGGCVREEVCDGIAGLEVVVVSN
jgi:hypothetical protein